MKKSSAAILIIISILFCSSSSYAARKALLVGVAKYQNLPAVSNGRMVENLKGPVNDVNIMKDALKTYYGFTEKDIKILNNNEATRANIEALFDNWLVKESKEGDLVLFYFSGHGSKVKDFNGDEDDGYDEVLLPYDTAPNSGYNIIVDDELGMWLQRLHGRRVVTILDSCYSGGVVRSIKGEIVSTLEDVPSRQPKFIPIENFQPSSSALAVPKGTPDVPEAVIFITASQEYEIAFETSTPQGFHGGFTYALYDGMKSMARPSYGSLFEYTKRMMKDRLKLPQEPQLVAKKDITFQPFPEPLPVIQPIPPVPPRIDNKPAPPPEIKGGKVLVAIEKIDGAGDKEMRKLREALSILENVTLTNEGEFYDRLIRGEKRGGQYHTRLLNLVGDIEEIKPVSSIKELVNEIKQGIDYAYLVKQLAHIHNPNPKFKVRLSVADESRRDFRIGEKITFRVEAEKDCYILLINMDSRGNFHIIFPNQFHQDTLIRANTAVVIPDDDMRKRSFDFEFSIPAGEETIKLIASTRPLNLESLGITDFGQAFPPIIGNTRIIMVDKIVGQINANLNGDSRFEWSEDTVVVRSHK